jgi:dTDP-4-amino-4,6-dideoxygalactose transaminase
MRVALLNLSQQYEELAKPIRERLDEIFATQRFILGPNVERFETAICDYTRAAHAVGVSSGTDALLAALMTLEIGPGDAVITTAFSFFGTAGSIARVGAKPIFIDIDPVTYNLSASKLEDYIDNHCQIRDGAVFDEQGARVRAIMPVHLFGLCCEMNSIDRIAIKHQLEVIEDAAQAMGAEYPFHSGSKQAGTMGKIGCFSFYPSKNLGAAGDAGMVVCHEKKLAERLRLIRQHGMHDRYYHQIVGGNFRLDEIQAAILDVKLPSLNKWSAARRAKAKVYREEFEEARLTDKIALPTEPFVESGLTNHHIYHQFVIRAEKRDELRKHLADRQIETAIYYPLGLHEQKCFEYLRYKSGDFPETARATRETLALPIYPEISREAQKYVVNSIAEFFE